MIAPVQESTAPQLTRRVCRILSAAWLRAWRQRHDSIDTGHLLLELVRESECCAARILSEFRVTGWRIRRAMPTRLMSFARPPNAAFVTTAACGRALDVAARDAADLNHPRVSAEHLLLALLQCPDCRATRTLRNLHVQPAEVCHRLLRLLADDAVYLGSANK
jgi:ATP-dependent Clp protease ATP-binding subunit ClpA